MEEEGQIGRPNVAMKIILKLVLEIKFYDFDWMQLNQDNSVTDSCDHINEFLLLKMLVNFMTF